MKYKWKHIRLHIDLWHTYHSSSHLSTVKSIAFVATGQSEMRPDLVIYLEWVQGPVAILDAMILTESKAVFRIGGSRMPFADFSRGSQSNLSVCPQGDTIGFGSWSSHVVDSALWKVISLVPSSVIHSFCRSQMYFWFMNKIKIIKCFSYKISNVYSSPNLYINNKYEQS